MTVDGDDAVSILCHHITIGIHAEGAHDIAVLPRLILQLGFVEDIGNIFKNQSRQFNSNSQIDLIID